MMSFSVALPEAKNASKSSTLSNLIYSGSIEVFALILSSKYCLPFASALILRSLSMLIDSRSLIKAVLSALVISIYIGVMTECITSSRTVSVNVFSLPNPNLPSASIFLSMFSGDKCIISFVKSANPPPSCDIELLKESELCILILKLLRAPIPEIDSAIFFRSAL